MNNKVEEVLGPEGTSKLIDYDMLDFGVCPNCGAQVSGEFSNCRECGVDWFNNTYEEIYEQIKG